MPDFIAQYVDQILEQAGLNKLPEDFGKEYRGKLIDSVQKRIGVLALKELDAKGVKEFEELTRNEERLNPDTLLDFFKSKIPNFEEKMTHGLEEFADEFIKGAKRLKTL